jgi:geranylgeranyl diphosphate synthase type I
MPGSESPFVRYLLSVEDELQRVLLPPDHSLASYYGMMHYHFGWADEGLQPTGNQGGKRLRPLLCLLACEAVGGDFHQAVPAAAAVEIIHNFSLAHDDIQDGDPVRRHRLTLWKVWGVPQALNVGDGLFALAHLAMEGLLGRGVSSSRFLAALQVLDRASLALIQGQYLDVSFEERPQVEEGEYLDMVAGKTAALFGCATQLGALLASDDSVVVEHYRRFGQKLGFAFQMTDDILGIWGDPTVTGKPSANDIVRKKKTLPVIYALRKSPALREIYNHDGIDEKRLAVVLGILDEVGARQYTESLADEYKGCGLAELESTRFWNRAQDQLRKLAEFLTVRSH